MNVNLITGDKLTVSDQKHVLAAFVHRFTKEHKPDWARKEWKDGKPYPVQYESDNEWLVTTQFAVNKDGSLDQRVKYCSSFPTWPDNPEFRIVSKS